MEAWANLYLLSLRPWNTYVEPDISGRNIAFTCSHLSNATEEDLFEVLGTPESELLARLDGEPLGKSLPTHLIKATEWEDWIDEDDEDIRIIDFGEVFLQGKEPKHLAQPGPLRVPETIFTDRFDHTVDLWRAGCMVSGLAPPSLQKVDINTCCADLLVYICNISIPIPWRWCMSWLHRWVLSRRCRMSGSQSGSACDWTLDMIWY